MAQLLAGTVYAGWWQTKLAALTRDVALARSNGVRPLIWLTDFVNLLRECRGDKGKSIGEDLMPFIDSGELWIGGEVTPNAAARPGDPRWRQRVEPLGLEEPSPRQMRAILEATVARLAPDVEGAPDDCVRRELGRALEQAQLQAARFLPEDGPAGRVAAAGRAGARQWRVDLALGSTSAV
ncbi:MAG: hypothetical protein IPF51_03630 [Dehalococcoidia bacterium]|uniref:hypothetical protein n=1 Tax=Candidatus Amarobacter glycogenicus TaxID=3140699 RepID=UPI003134CD20|nr:hypothetical protein [Dehalococcoidia bacterium]